MKLIYVFGVLILFSLTTYGQNVGIGTSSPNALLDVSATNNGILVPRVALTGTGSASPLTSPTTSTLVYNTATVTNVTPGYYYWSGTAWTRLIDNASIGGATTVSNTSSANTLSTTVNGVTGATVPMVNSISNTSSSNTLSTTVNGVTGTGVPIINSNALSMSGNNLTATINGIGSSAQSLSGLSISGDVTGTLASSTVGKIQGTGVAITSLATNNLLQYNGINWVNVTPASMLGTATTHTLSLSTNTLTSTVNGVAATSSAVSGVSNTSSVNTLSTTVNGVTGTGVNIINTNALSQNGSNQLISTINGIGSTAYTVGITGDVTGNLGTSTVAKIQGQPVSATTPTAGQVLEYSSGTWTPTSPGSALFTAGTGLSWSGSTLNSVWTASGSNIYNNNSGNVGVGSTAPAGKMSIITTSSDGNVGAWGAGQLTVGQDGTTAGALGFSYSTTNNAGYISSLSPAIAWRDLGLRANNTIFYYNGGTEGMRLNTSGYVGIAQPSPAGPLDVNGRASATSFKVGSSFGDLTNNSPWYGIGMSNLTLSGQGSTAVQIGGYYGINFAESGANRMVINLGNVGIGNVAPNGKLDVYNTGSNGDGAVFAPDIDMDNNFSIQTYIDATGTGGWANRTTYAGGCCNNLALQPNIGTVSVGGVSGNYGNKFNVFGNSYFSGNVGVGNPAPNGKLDVYNTGSNGDGAVFAPDGDADNNFSIQTYIDAAAGGGWANRTTYAGGCCNNLALQPNIGTVTIGSTSGGGGSYKLVVNGTSNFTGNIYLNTGQMVSLQRGNFYLALQSDRNMVLYDNGGAVWASNTSVSDIRTKDHIVPLEEMLPTIMKLSAIRFNYKKELDMGDERHIGVIAQEINKYFPDMVYYDTKADRYLVYYDKLTTILIKGMQEQQKEIEDIKASNSMLQTENNSIKASVEALKQIIGAKAQR